MKVKVKSLSRVRLFATPWTAGRAMRLSVHGIFQARVLEWVAISFSGGSSRPRDRTPASRIVGRRFYRLSHQKYRQLTGKITFCESSVYYLLTQVALVVKNLPANAGDIEDVGSNPGLGRQPWRRTWQPTPIFLPGESLGQRSLADYSPQGRTESDMTEATQRTVQH